MARSKVASALLALLVLYSAAAHAHGEQVFVPSMVMLIAFFIFVLAWCQTWKYKIIAVVLFYSATVGTWMLFFYSQVWRWFPEIVDSAPFLIAFLWLLPIAVWAIIVLAIRNMVRSHLAKSG